MKLIMIRHGRTEANEKRLYCGKTDLPLSESGVKELEAVKDSGLPDISGFRIITSGMKRCGETLSVLYGITEYETDPDFREMDFGAFEMRSYEEMKNDPEYIAWISGDNEANIAPGGESGNIMTDRVISGLKRLLADGRDSLLITHGGVIAAVMAYLYPDENKNRYEWQSKPGHGYIIDTEENKYEAF